MGLQLHNFRTAGVLQASNTLNVAQLCLGMRMQSSRIVLFYMIYLTHKIYHIKL